MAYESLYLGRRTASYSGDGDSRQNRISEDAIRTNLASDSIYWNAIEGTSRAVGRVTESRG